MKTSKLNVESELKLQHLSRILRLSEAFLAEPSPNPHFIGLARQAVCMARRIAAEFIAEAGIADASKL